MALLNSFRNGVSRFGIWLIFASGLLILLIVSRKKSSASQTSTQSSRPPSNKPGVGMTGPQPPAAPVNPEIDYILVTAGYSPDMARYWTAVSKFETANYTSQLFRQGNNLFGMGVPSVRRSLRSGEWTGKDGGEMRKFSAYASTADSVKDLVLYMQSFSYPVTFDSPGALVNFMKSKNYFESDPAQYLAGIKRYL